MVVDKATKHKTTNADGTEFKHIFLKQNKSYVKSLERNTNGSYIIIETRHISDKTSIRKITEEQPEPSNGSPE